MPVYITSLILDNGHFGGKFKDVCQKNISFIEFPHALNLNKTVQVYHFIFSCSHSYQCAWYMAKCTECVISRDLCNSQLLFCIIIIFVREKKVLYLLVRASWNRSSLLIKYFNLLYFKLLKMNVGVNIP